MVCTVCRSIFSSSKIVKGSGTSPLPHRTMKTWWRHQMETFSALLDLCAGNSPVTGEFPSQRPVMRSFDVLFDMGLNKCLSKQLWGWWFGTPSHPLCHNCNEKLSSLLRIYLCFSCQTLICILPSISAHRSMNLFKYNEGTYIGPRGWYISVVHKHRWLAISLITAMWPAGYFSNNS